MSVPPAPVPTVNVPVVFYGLSGDTNRAPLPDFGVTDCAVLAESEKGVGLLSNCDQGPGLVGVFQDLTPNTPLLEIEAGVVGTSNPGPGVAGWSTNSFGVQGSSTNSTGVRAMSINGDGVDAKTAKGTGVNGSSGQGSGVRGESGNGTFLQDAGVVGQGSSPANFGFGTGVLGVGNGPNSHGVIGSGESRAVWGLTSAGNGVQGQSVDGTGVFGDSTNSDGVRGVSSQGVGVFGQTYNQGSFAGLFSGNVQVTGQINKSATAFKIDHPKKPADMFLYHSAVESPDMKNIYDGIALLDSNGQAVVELPNWFDALNSDLRYQLTAIGQPTRDLHIAEEVNGNRFKIAGGHSGMKVCWQVTGVRQDAWAKANRIPVEEVKRGKERGHYLHPALFGKPQKMGIDFIHRPELLTETKKELASLPKLLRQVKQGKKIGPRKLPVRKARSRGHS